jgi:hypothetical protein
MVRSQQAVYFHGKVMLVSMTASLGSTKSVYYFLESLSSSIHYIRFEIPLGFSLRSQILPRHSKARRTPQ